MDAQTVNSKVKPILNEMSGDGDKDVAYYAKVAVNSC